MKLSRQLHILPNNEKLENSILTEFKSLNKECENLKSDIRSFQVYKNANKMIVLTDTKSELANTILTEKINGILSKNKSIEAIKLSPPLERIFKKPLAKNELSLPKNEFKRCILTLELKKQDHLIQEYKEIHKPHNIPQQVLTNMDTIGVIDMELYLFKNLGFLIMDLPLDFNMQKDFERWSKLEYEKKWQQLVGKFQKVNTNDGSIEKWKEMNKIIDWE